MLLLLMNLGFAGGTAAAPGSFQAAWAKGSNVVMTPKRTA